MSRLRNILAQLNEAASAFRAEEPEETPAQTETPETPDIREIATKDQRKLNEAYRFIGKTMARNAFGSALDQLPSRVHSLEGTETSLHESVLPYTENYRRLTRALYENQEPTVYREDYESAALLYVVSEVSGRTYEQLFPLDEETQRNLTEQQLAPIVQDEKLLSEFIQAVIPALARGAAVLGSALRVGGGVAAKQIAKGAMYAAAKRLQKTEPPPQESAPEPKSPLTENKKIYIDVGNLPPAEAKAWLEKVRARLKK